MSERGRGTAPRPPPPPQEAGGAGTGAGRSCRRGLPAGPPPPACGAAWPRLYAAHRALGGRCGGEPAARPGSGWRGPRSALAVRAGAGSGGSPARPRTDTGRLARDPRGSGSAPEGPRGLGCEPSWRTLPRTGPEPGLDRAGGSGGAVADVGPARGPSLAGTRCLLCGMEGRVKDVFVWCVEGENLLQTRLSLACMPLLCHEPCLEDAVAPREETYLFSQDGWRGQGCR